MINTCYSKDFMVTFQITGAGIPQMPFCSLFQVQTGTKVESTTFRTLAWYSFLTWKMNVSGGFNSTAPPPSQKILPTVDTPTDHLLFWEQYYEQYVINVYILYYLHVYVQKYDILASLSSVWWSIVQHIQLCFHQNICHHDLIK